MSKEVLQSGILIAILGRERIDWDNIFVCVRQLMAGEAEIVLRL
jgi:hypothetical protein